MKPLRKDDKRGDPECVSCHATQKACTTEVAHFRTDESVMWILPRAGCRARQ